MSSAKAGSQLLWSHKDREEWFSLGENHEKVFRVGLHQLRNRCSICRMAVWHRGQAPRFPVEVIGVGEGHAVPAGLDRTRGRIQRSVQEIRVAGIFLFFVVTAVAQSHSVPEPGDHPPPAWFVDYALQAGLTMQNVNGDEATKKYIIETTGSGVAILDYDRDGCPDIYLVNGNALAASTAQNKNPPPTGHLYHNNHDGTFTDVTKAAGLAASGWGQGACVGDYDNDGFDDLYVTYYGKNRLYHNEGNGTFKEVAAEAGVAGRGGEWGAGCAFVDYDRDGKLDLVVANYVHFDIKNAPRPGKGQMCI